MNENSMCAQGLLGLECLNCALNQVTAIAELAKLPRAEAMQLMQKAVEQIAHKGVDRNNCELISEVYHMALEYTKLDDPYRDIRSRFDTDMMRLWPETRAHILESADPLRSAISAAIAGNLIDLAALGLGVSMEDALNKLREVDETGLFFDDVDSLADALSSARTLLVLGDNCGEIAMDRLLIETIRRLYPHLQIQYGVRGAPIVNDATREDAAIVHMEEVAEVIDNGDCVLGTVLYRTSEEFNRAFYAADVIISKGMGNYEGLFDCDRGSIWFMLIVKCEVLSRLISAPKGSIICKRKD